MRVLQNAVFLDPDDVENYKASCGLNVQMILVPRTHKDVFWGSPAWTALSPALRHDGVVVFYDHRTGGDVVDAVYAPAPRRNS